MRSTVLLRLAAHSWPEVGAHPIVDKIYTLQDDPRRGFGQCSASASRASSGLHILMMPHVLDLMMWGSAMAKRTRSPFDRGLIDFGAYIMDFDEQALSRAIGTWQAARSSEPSNPAVHLALGYALDSVDRTEEALEAVSIARELDPDRLDTEIMYLTLLAELGREAEALDGIEAAAARDGVDLAALRQELGAAGNPTDARTLLMNGFLRARNWIRSWLLDEVDRAEAVAGRHKTGPEDDLDECLSLQAAIGEELEWTGVPEPLRPLGPWAARLGAGDDVCRPLLFATLSVAERSELQGIVSGCASAAHLWLDEFGSRPLSDEAAALMSLLLGIEEME